MKEFEIVIDYTDITIVVNDDKIELCERDFINLCNNFFNEKYYSERIVDNEAEIIKNYMSYEDLLSLVDHNFDNYNYYDEFVIIDDTNYLKSYHNIKEVVDYIYNYYPEIIIDIIEEML